MGLLVIAAAWCGFVGIRALGSYQEWRRGSWEADVWRRQDVKDQIMADRDAYRLWQDRQKMRGAREAYWVGVEEAPGWGREDDEGYDA